MQFMQRYRTNKTKSSVAFFVILLEKFARNVYCRIVWCQHMGQDNFVFVGSNHVSVKRISAKLLPHEIKLERSSGLWPHV